MNIPFNAVPEWSITVTDTKPNATDELLRTGGGYESPKPGNQFFLAYIEATYLGPDSSMFRRAYRTKTVGQLGVVYEQDIGCYLNVSDGLQDRTELFTGGTVKGWDCWEIAADDAGSLQLMLDPGYDGERERVWFRLK